MKIQTKIIWALFYNFEKGSRFRNRFEWHLYHFFLHNLLKKLVTATSLFWQSCYKMRLKKVNFNLCTELQLPQCLKSGKLKQQWKEKENWGFGLLLREFRKVEGTARLQIASWTKCTLQNLLIAIVGFANMNIVKVSYWEMTCLKRRFCMIKTL